MATAGTADRPIHAEPCRHASAGDTLRTCAAAPARRTRPCRARLRCAGVARAAGLAPRASRPQARRRSRRAPSPTRTLALTCPHPEHVHAAAVQQVRAQQHLAARHILQQRAALRRGQVAERRGGKQEWDDVRPPRRRAQLRALLLEARLRARRAPPCSSAGGRRCTAQAGCIEQGCAAARSTAGPSRCAVRGAARSLVPQEACARNPLTARLATLRV